MAENAINAYLTHVGAAVLNKVLAAQGTLHFSKAELGVGSESSEEGCRARTSLISKCADADLVRAALKDGTATLSVTYKNDDLEEGFYVREMGLYVTEPDTKADVLYCYVQFTKADWIVPASTATYVRTYDIVTAVSSLTSLTITTNPSTAVTMDDLGNIIAPQFDAGTSYVQGAIVLYGGALYCAVTEFSGEWDSDFWQQIDVQQTLIRTLHVSSTGTLTWANGLNTNNFNLKTILGNLFYPVGCIYMETTGKNPATTLGFGTWTAWGSGKVPVGVDASDTDLSSAEKTGGEKTHTLTESEMPAHVHYAYGNSPAEESAWSFQTVDRTQENKVQVSTSSSSKKYVYSATDSGGINHPYITASAGGGEAHNNMPPYITCYMWKRTA